MKKQLILSLCAAAVTPLFAAPGAAPKMPPVKVYTAPAVSLNKAYAKHYAGQVVPIEEVAIVPRVTGIIQKICFKEGNMVKAGQLLFEIEDVTYRAKADTARAAVIQSKAALTLAQTNYNRYSSLIKSNAVSQSVYDEAVKTLAAAKAQMTADEANLRDAENTLSYTRIYSPITGRIGKCTLTPGNLVTTATGTIVTITQIAPIYVQFAIGERVFREDFGGMKGFAQNADVQAELADHTVYKEHAKIAIIDSKVDKSTNTIQIWAEFANKDMEILPGSYVTVMLGQRNITKFAGVIPSALQIDAKGAYVYVMGDKNVPVRRNIVSGDINGDLLEVRSGLKPGEVVVVDGSHKIMPNTPVIPVPYNKTK